MEADTRCTLVCSLHSFDSSFNVFVESNWLLCLNQLMMMSVCAKPGSMLMD